MVAQIASGLRRSLRCGSGSWMPCFFAAALLASIVLACTSVAPTLVLPAPLGCRQDDVRSQMEAFFAAVNRGDRAALEKLLSPAFVGYAIGSPEPWHVKGREETIAYFAERPGVGERLALVAIAVVPYQDDPNVDFKLTVHRDLRALHMDYEGKGAVYCGSAVEARGITALALGNGQ